MKNIFNKFIFLSCAITPVISLPFSISYKSNRTKQGDNIKYKYEYIHTFSDVEFNYFNNSSIQNIYETNEMIFANENFLVKFDSQQKQGEFYIDLYNGFVKKWYFIKITLDNKNEQNDKDFKNIFLNSIIKNIIANWKNDVSKKFSIRSNIALEGKIKNEAHTSFKSSWGVWNHSKRNFDAEYFLDETMLKKEIMFSEKEESSIFIESKKINNFYVMPLIEVLNKPIGSCYWINDGLILNNNNIKIADSQAKKNIMLPKSAYEGQEWWRWFTNGYSKGEFFVKSGIALLSASVGALTSPVGGAAIGFAIGTAFSLYLERIIEQHKKNYNDNKYVIDNFYESITQKGHKYEIKNNLGLSNIILFSSDIVYGAKATAIFGDKSEAKIYSAPAIAEIDLEVRKYVKI